MGLNASHSEGRDLSGCGTMSTTVVSSGFLYYSSNVNNSSTVLCVGLRPHLHGLLSMFMAVDLVQLMLKQPHWQDIGVASDISRRHNLTDDSLTSGF